MVIKTLSKPVMNHGRLNQGALAVGSSFVLIVAGAVALGSFPLLSIAAVLASIYVIVNLVKIPTRISVERSIEKNSAWVGEDLRINLQVHIENGLGPVFITCPIPAVTEIAEGSNVFLVWKGLKAKSVDLSFSFRASVRGVFIMEPVMWEAHHPFRLKTPLQRQAGEPVEIVVRAGIREISRVTNLRGLAVNPRPMMDIATIGNQTTEFREIRQFTPGDPIRAVNWKATARASTSAVITSSDLMVNEFEREGKKAIWLFVDTTSAMTVGSSLVNPLEHAIEAAGTLSFYYLRRGYQVGAHLGSVGTEMIHLDSGQHQLRKINRQLLEISSKEGEYDLRRAAHICRHQILRYVPECFIITRLDLGVPRQSGGVPPELDSLIDGVKSLSRHGARGRKSVRVTIISIPGYAFSTTAGDGSSEAARAVRSIETQVISRAVRRYGATVIEWDPTQSKFSDLLLAHALNRA